MVLSLPIVELIYERGKFLPHDSAATAAALMFYAPGLLGYSAVKIASPTFYSLRDSRTPVLVSVGSVAANLVLNLILVRVMGFRGLALGTAIAAVLNATLLLFFLSRRLGGLDGKSVASSGARIVVASALMGIVVHFLSGLLVTLLPGDDFVIRLIRVFTSIGAGVLTLVIVARLLRIEEFDMATSRVLARLGRR
jgi:putative peptidoglycan lipid II flippase